MVLLHFNVWDNGSVKIKIPPRFVEGFIKSFKYTYL